MLFCANHLPTLLATTFPRPLAFASLLTVDGQYPADLKVKPFMHVFELLQQWLVLTPKNFGRSEQHQNHSEAMNLLWPLLRNALSSLFFMDELDQISIHVWNSVNCFANRMFPSKYHGFFVETLPFAWDCKWTSHLVTMMARERCHGDHRTKLPSPKSVLLGICLGFFCKCTHCIRHAT